jgi:hypothetical protein
MVVKKVELKELPSAGQMAASKAEKKADLKDYLWADLMAGLWECSMADLMAASKAAKKAGL